MPYLDTVELFQMSKMCAKLQDLTADKTCLTLIRSITSQWPPSKSETSFSSTCADMRKRSRWYCAIWSACTQWMIGKIKQSVHRFLITWRSGTHACSKSRFTKRAWIFPKWQFLCFRFGCFNSIWVDAKLSAQKYVGTDAASRSFRASTTTSVFFKGKL